MKTPPLNLRWTCQRAFYKRTDPGRFRSFWAFFLEAFWNGQPVGIACDLVDLCLVHLPVIRSPRWERWTQMYWAKGARSRGMQSAMSV